jgi:hypothetical protein|tara:strand:+ start:7796 stop:8515 length:720 start_codon:yes stop_codon:yes gene_type:complete
MNKNIIKVTPDYISKIIREEKEFIKEHELEKRVMLAKANALHADGLSRQEVNESIFKDLLARGLGAYVYEITRWLVGKLPGLNPDGLIAKSIGNSVEQILIEASQTDDPIKYIQWYFSEGGCEEFADTIIAGVMETGMEAPIDGFVMGLGVNKDSMFYTLARETLTDELQDTQLFDDMRETIAIKICEIDVREIVGGGWDLIGQAKDYMSDLVSPGETTSASDTVRDAALEKAAQSLLP